VREAKAEAEADGRSGSESDGVGSEGIVTVPDDDPEHDGDGSDMRIEKKGSAVARLKNAKQAIVRVVGERTQLAASRSAVFESDTGVCDVVIGAEDVAHALRVMERASGAAAAGGGGGRWPLVPSGDGIDVGSPGISRTAERWVLEGTRAGYRESTAAGTTSGQSRWIDSYDV